MMNDDDDEDSSDEEEKDQASSPEEEEQSICNGKIKDSCCHYAPSSSYSSSSLSLSSSNRSYAEWVFSPMVIMRFHLAKKRTSMTKVPEEELNYEK